MPFILLSTNPTELRFAPSACHVATSSIFRYRGLTLDAFSDQEITHHFLVLPIFLILALSFVPLITTSEAHLSRTLSARPLPFAATCRLLQNILAIRSWTSLELLVRPYLHIL